MDTTLRPCGHRLSEKQRSKIRKHAKKNKIQEGPMLRKMIDEWEPRDEDDIYKDHLA